MKTHEIRKLIGQEIEWTDRPDARGWSRGYSGTVLEVKGRNVLVERGGNDWFWLPEMYSIKVKTSSGTGNPA